MATHSSVLAWRIPGVGSHRVRHNWSDLAVADLYTGALAPRTQIQLYSNSSISKWVLFWQGKSNFFKVSQGTQLPSTTGCTPLFLCLLLDILGLKQRYCTSVLYPVLCREVHKSTAACGGCTCDMWTNSHDWICKCMYACLKAYNVKFRM